ncbi:protein-export chaperone SecB [Pseudomonas sp. B392_1p]|uniref:protein-export chaperone SecB n=1 Tax=Pseudomonas sp. B392_1p TaxID=3457507 RepID=UPI003FD2E72F
MKLHPIQLIGTFVDKLEIDVHNRHDFPDDSYPKDFKYIVYRTDFDEESSEVSVKVELSIKPATEEVDRPFSMIVAVSGHFRIDTSKFPAEHIENWCFKNAPVILLPFIRDHAYSLSMRAGFNPVLLPLVEVPNFVISNNG